jgi:hypothetical protein
VSKGNHAQPILKVAAENLRVGEKLIAAWEEIVKVNSDTIDIGTTLPHDDTRVWCVVPAGKVAP